MADLMAVDKYGQYYRIEGKHPRKSLLDHFGTKHAQKMYRDTKDGKAVHVGYIIAGLCLEIFKVTRWKESEV